jgi:hypothetical protein
MRFAEVKTKEWGQRNESGGVVFLYSARKRKFRLVAEDVSLPRAAWGA